MSIQPVPDMLDGLEWVVSVSEGIDTTKVGTAHSTIVRALFQNQKVFRTLNRVAKLTGADKQAEFKRHVEPRQLFSASQLGSGKIVEA